jgi:hypothetical protein
MAIHVNTCIAIVIFGEEAYVHISSDNYLKTEKVQLPE